MKKILPFLFSLGTLFSQSQILNPGFESVTGTKPNNYNLNTSYFNYSTFYVRDTSDAHTGLHAAYIKGFGGQSYTVQGSLYGLFSAAGKPASFSCWYKCNLQPGDSLVSTPYLYFGNLASSNTGAYAFTTVSSSVYKQLTATFNYSNYPLPTVDTVYVAIYLSGLNKDSQNIYIPQTGTWAIIDDLELNQPLVAAVAEHQGNTNVEKIYPQPCTNMSFMVYTIDEAVASTLTVYDIAGKQVKTVFENEKQSPGRYKAELDMSGLAPGIYLAKLKTGNETRVSKIIKQ